MKRIATVFLFLVTAVGARAGTITSGLLEAYAKRGANEALPVLIALSDPLDAAALSARLGAKRLPLAEIHRQVMDSLQSRASETQPPVIKSIEILAATGMASAVRPFWIANLLSAQLTKAGAELVANMAGVAEVGLDEPITLRKMLESSAAPAARGGGGSVLAALNVRQAWELGFRGEGRAVCVIANGAQTTSEALASRWRGRAQAALGWFDPAGSVVPNACGDEGTYAVALACGLNPATGDTIGLAPAAEWMAARLFCDHARLSDFLRALEWACDPDGNPATADDVPDAIFNSWGMKAACRGAEPKAFWDAITNAEALGPVLVFAAHESTLAAAPAVQAPEAQEICLAIGNLETQSPAARLHKASGRGPSPCSAQLFKPDLVAPGTRVTTLSAEGKPLLVSGTAAAAAITAGAITLIRQANPTLSAAEVKHILRTTATDLGSPGADNTFGYGLVNAGHAVLSALATGSTGSLSGVVRYGIAPVSGARVQLSGPAGTRETTAIGGVFRFDYLPAGKKYALRAARFGYKPYLRPDSIYVQEGQITNIYVDLQRGFADDAEFDQGWSLGVEGDKATGGTWIRAIPVGSFVGGKAVQPDHNATPGGRFCFVTGNANSPDADAKEADVDGGRTTLRSPLFNLTELVNPELRFSYWYSNDRGPNPGADFFRAQISNDGGATWVNLINTAASTNGWVTVSVRVSDFVKPTERMLLQFVAEDLPPASLVEAAVDDIVITGEPGVPEPPRELKMDVQFDQVLLSWRRSEDASRYRVYLSGNPDRVVAPECLFTTTTDTTLIVPMSSIPFDEFYFQVTAEK